MAKILHARAGPKRRQSREPRPARKAAALAGASPSLKVSDGFRAFVLDQLEGVGQVTARSMFGGVGLYCDGFFFGIIARDELYFKVNDDTRATFERAGAHPFRPYPDRPTTMQYYSVPVEVLESPIELARWARSAVAATRG